MNVFSATKGARALQAYVLAERRAIDMDAPVAAAWPEFGAWARGASSWPSCSTSAGLLALRAEPKEGALYDWQGP